MPESQTASPDSDNATLDAMRQQATPPPQRPEGLPEKFTTVADLAKSYSELEKKLGSQTSQDKPESKAGEKPADKAADKPSDAAQQEMLKPYFDEYAKDGKLSDKSYAELAQKGISKAVVDAYAKSVQANDPAKVLEAVGGQEVFDQISQWSTTNLSPEERADYNAALAAGGPSAKIALRDLKSRMDASLGTDPAVHVSGSSKPSAEKFASSAEIIKAMSDPRYQYDTAYRDKVAAMMP